MTAVPKHSTAVSGAATEAGLVDVSFDVADTQIGPLLLAVTERGLCRISFDPEPDRETETLARTFGVRVLRAPRELDPVRRELDEYFEGRRRDFDLPLDLRGREASRATSSSAREGALRRGHDLQVARGRGRQPPRRPRGRDDHERNPIPIVLPATAWSARTEASSATRRAMRKRLLLDLEAGTPRLDIHLS